MVAQSRIQAVADDIARLFCPLRIVLFGSYAYGTPHEHSDVDLLVVMPFEGRERAKSLEIHRAVHAGFPMDVLVYDSETLRQRLEWEDFFLREVTQRGRVLYEADHAGVG